jgi:hypothetical protein
MESFNFNFRGGSVLTIGGGPLYHFPLPKEENQELKNNPDGHMKEAPLGRDTGSGCITPTFDCLGYHEVIVRNKLCGFTEVR